MKKLNFILSAIIIAGILIVGFNSITQTKNQYATIRTMENFVSSDDMIIVYPDGTYESISMKKLNFNNPLNLRDITEQINNMGNKGYRLISTSKGATSNSVITTYFKKKE